MVVLKRSGILLVLLFQSGCTSITEYEVASSASLHVLSGSDLSTITTVTDIPGARSLLIYPGNIFVASTEGSIYRYDSESMALIQQNLIDSPSPAGFHQMVFKQRGNSAYLIGSMGKILEISLPDCSVIDVFSICGSPVELLVAQGNPPYLYVADGSTNQIYKVSTKTNLPLSDTGIYYTISCMEAIQNCDSIIVGTANMIYIVESTGPGTLRATTCSGLSCIRIDAIPGSADYVAILENPECSVVLLRTVENPEPGQTFLVSQGSVSITGELHMIAAGTDWSHAYVLSYTGNYVSRLISYNYNTGKIDDEIELPGYPLDLKVSGYNNVYALTTE